MCQSAPRHPVYANDSVEHAGFVFLGVAAYYPARCLYLQTKVTRDLCSTVSRNPWPVLLCESDKAFIHPLKSVIILLYSEAIVVVSAT